jgi:hypothetical protein
MFLPLGKMVGLLPTIAAPFSTRNPVPTLFPSLRHNHTTPFRPASRKGATIFTLYHHPNLPFYSNKPPLRKYRNTPTSYSSSKNNSSSTYGADIPAQKAAILEPEYTVLITLD